MYNISNAKISIIKLENPETFPLVLKLYSLEETFSSFHSYWEMDNISSGLLFGPTKFSAWPIDFISFYFCLPQLLKDDVIFFPMFSWGFFVCLFLVGVCLFFTKYVKLNVSGQQRRELYAFPASMDAYRYLYGKRKRCCFI